MRHISPAILRIAALPVLLATCWIYHLPALDQFFSQDDFPLLATSRPGWVEPGQFWLQGSPREYRPLTQHFYFYLNQILFDLDARAHHGMNLAVHLANVVLLYALARRWLATLAGALFAAAVYGFHSIHFWEIYWVSGISQLGVVFFSLLSLLFFSKFQERGQPGYGALTLLAAAAALLSKEDAVALPALLGLLYWYQRGRADRRSGAVVLAAWLLLPLLIIWRVAFLGFGLPSAGPYTFGAGLLQLHEKLWSYGRWMLPGVPALVGVLLLLAFLAACHPPWKFRPALLQRAAQNEKRARRRELTFLLLLVLAPAIPSFLIPSASEHYLNLPAAAAALLLAAAAEGLPARLQGPLLAAAAGLFIAGAAAKTDGHLKSRGWAVPVPAKAAASRELFDMLQRTPLPEPCSVQLLYPPIEPWEKNWLIFLPKLATGRPALDVQVVAPGEPPPATRDGCRRVFRWTSGRWE